MVNCIVIPVRNSQSCILVVVEKSTLADENFVLMYRAAYLNDAKMVYKVCLGPYSSQRV